MSSNREFIGQHRARQAQRREAPAYWALALIAEACGVSEHELHYKFLPSFWGVPRDWNVVRGVTLYRADALPELADELAQQGRPEAAEKLRAWWSAQRSANELTAGSGGGTETKGLGASQTSAAPAQESKPWYQGEAGGMGWARHASLFGR